MTYPRPHPISDIGGARTQASLLDLRWETPSLPSSVSSTLCSWESGSASTLFSKEMKNNGLNQSPYSLLFLRDNHAMTVTQRTYFLIPVVIFALPRRLMFLSIPLKI